MTQRMMTQDGEWFVEFYKDRRGRVPAYEFIEGLDTRAHAAALRVLDLLQGFGTRLSMPHARHIEGSLWELRPGGNRLFYFLHTGRRFIILHGYRKKGRRTPRKEIATAKRRMQDFLER